MKPKKWFLIEIVKGSIKVRSGFYDSFEEALGVRKSKLFKSNKNISVVETVHG